MPEIRPARFPRTPRAQVRLCNFTITRRLILTLNIAGESITLALGPAVDMPGDIIALNAGSGSAWLTLKPTLFEQWLRPWIGSETLTQLPSVLRKAAYHAALAPLFAALHAATGIVFVLTESPTPLPESPARLGLWLTDTPDGNPSALLHLDDATVAALTTRLEHLPAAGVKEPWPGLPVHITLWIGQTWLTPQELRQLERSDILLLPPSAPDAPLELMLRQAGWPLAIAHLQRRQLLIARLVPTAMSEPSQAPATPPSALDPDDLKIRLDFDLGCLTLPLRELRTIQPGYSFELDRPDSQSVRIVAGSQVIGYGELVHIDDRLGVRVTSLFQSPE